MIYTAIQCKFYGPNSVVSKDDVDTFITASGIHVPGGPRFSKRIFVSTTDRWTTNAEESLNQEIKVARLGIENFENSSVGLDTVRCVQSDRDGAARAEVSPAAPARGHQRRAGRFQGT